MYTSTFKIFILSLIVSWILDDLRNGHRSLSISSYFRTSILSCWSSTRTELVQKWSLLVRIRTIVDRISICFSNQETFVLDQILVRWRRTWMLFNLYNRVELYLHRRNYNKLGSIRRRSNKVPNCCSASFNMALAPSLDGISCCYHPYIPSNFQPASCAVKTPSYSCNRRITTHKA